jgi:hypothetical protein
MATAASEDHAVTLVTVSIVSPPQIQAVLRDGVGCLRVEGDRAGLHTSRFEAWRWSRSRDYTDCCGSATPGSPSSSAGQESRNGEVVPRTPAA